MLTFELHTPQDSLLITEPVDFDKLRLRLKKDDNYDGVFFEQGGSLGFYGEALAFIRQRLDNDGYSAPVYFRVTKQCPGQSPQIIIDARLNLLSYKEDDERGLLFVDLEPNDRFIAFTANFERAEDVNACPSMTIELPGVITGLSSDLPAIVPQYIETTTGNITQKVPFYVETQEEDFYEFFDWRSNAQGTWLYVKKAVEVRVFTGVVQAGMGLDNCMVQGYDIYSPSHGVSFKVFGQTLVFREYDKSPQGQEVFPPLGNYDYELIHEGTSFTLNLQPGQLLEMEASLWRNSARAGCDQTILYDGSARLEWHKHLPAKITLLAAPFPASSVKVYRAKQLLNYLIQKASNNAYSLQSDFFDSGCGASLVLTSGKDLRGDTQSATATLKDIYTGLKNMFNLSLALVPGNKIKIEPKDVFYQNTGVYKSFEAQVKRQMRKDLFKIIEIGYEKFEAQSTGGKFEFNGKRQYEIEVPELKGKQTRVSNLIAATFIIDKVRRYRYKPTTDNKHDYDWFVIQLNAQNQADATATHKYLNLGISPPVLIQFYKEELSGFIQGTASLKRTEIKGHPADSVEHTSHVLPCGGTLPGDSSLSLSSAERIFSCFEAEAEVPLTLDDFEDIKNNTDKLYEIRSCSGVYRGYIQELSFDFTEGVANLKLIEV